MPDSDRQDDELVICVRPQGEVDCLYRDELRLEQLGALQVRRASHVEFDEDKGVWVAREANGGGVIASHPRRSVCLGREVEHFNEKLTAGLRPFDD